MQDRLFADYETETFTFEGRQVRVTLPSGTPLGIPVIKTEYDGAFVQLEECLLACGCHRIFMENKNRWGTDADHRVRRALLDHLASRYGVRRSYLTVGMSCGGLHSVNYASRYPESVGMLYLDAPLLSMVSYPMLHRDRDRVWPEIAGAYGFSDPSEVFLYNEQPVHRLAVLADHGIPATLVYGDADTTVPAEQNAEVFAAYYRFRGCSLRVYVKHGCDHHPHGPADPLPVVRDLLARYRG